MAEQLVTTPKPLATGEALLEKRTFLWSLFKDVLHVRDTYRNQYFEDLWDKVAPEGNIYKRNAIYVEQRYHSFDLWKQMRELAEKYQPLLEGNEKRSIEQCMQILYDELEKTTVHILDFDGEDPREIKGYPPIREFLIDKVQQVGPLLMYMDREKRVQEIKHRLVALNVFLLQTLAPALIFFNRWSLPSNRFKSLLHFSPGKSWKEEVLGLFCIGTTVEEACTTLLGAQLLIAINLMIQCFVDQQVRDFHKWQRLPHSSFYLFVDMFANSWCVVFVMFAIPLMFWSEDNPTTMVLDSMTLLFLFKVDDLTDVLCSYIGMTQEDFQRTVSSMTAFLAHCPVELEKVIRPDAKTKEDLWQIKLTKDGKLVGVDGVPCETRLHWASGPEETLDVGDFGFATQTCQRFTSYGATTQPEIIQCVPLSKIRLVGHRSKECSSNLPSSFTIVLATVWETLSWFVLVCNFVVPIVWLLLNQVCHSP